MISLYRWCPGQAHGTWTELPDLPEGGKIPADEVWWLDLDDPSPEEEALVFGKFLKVHPLTLEDVSRPRREADHAAHLPKAEEFPDYLFVIANTLEVADQPGPDGHHPAAVRQLSAVLTHQVLITHHYQPLPAVTECKQFLYRHAAQAGRGPDYLFHRILDEIVDEFAPAVDRVTDRLEDIELAMFDAPSRHMLAELIRVKRAVVALRKTLILQREVLARLMRGEFELVDEREIAYYRNVFDHLVRYTELIEGAREMVSDLMQTHLAAVSNQLNGIMKTLTMFSIVGVVCTLIAGVYGMNFENMPEIKWQYGYPFAIGLMAVAAVVMLGLFRWRRWI
jgi:magnesium transporter